MKPVLNKRFDLGGNELFRLIKINLFAKFLPIGNLRGGPGSRCLAALTILHYCGYPLYWFIARYGHRLGFIKQLMAKLRN